MNFREYIHYIKEKMSTAIIYNNNRILYSRAHRLFLSVLSLMHEQLPSKSMNEEKKRVWKFSIIFTYNFSRVYVCPSIHIWSCLFICCCCCYYYDIYFCCLLFFFFVSFALLTRSPAILSFVRFFFSMSYFSSVARQH